MEFILTNCNNIDSGTITIVPQKLNIRFGINGTGKSTIAKAIKFAIENREELKQLIPFKSINAETGLIPDVILPDNINSVLIFNEEYLNQFLFKENELISNSYEIFIQTPEYLESMRQIEEILSDIKSIFLENPDLDRIILDFESLSKSFSTTQTGLSKTSHISKGLKDGNKIKHIPEELTGYSKFIEHKSCTNWLDWLFKGEEFLNISDDCPYCTSNTTEKKEIIKSVSTFYDKNVIKNFNIILEALKSLGEYLTEDANQTLKTITEKQSSLEKAEGDYIVEVKSQIDNLLERLKTLKNISSSNLKKDENVGDILKNMKINIELYDRFKSEKTYLIIASINQSLDTVLEKVGIIQGEINKQKRLVTRLVERHKKKINSFLDNAGFKYHVELDSGKSDYKLLLRHIESSTTLNGGKQHLSFGEKNAFAIVLFMYHALSKNPDLIILDDPISSFDKNKKYAIMDMLFRGDRANCLKGRSVLMLTHDIEPIIDTVNTLKRTFSNISESKYIYTNSGILYEKVIKKENLLTFAKICKTITSTSVDEIIKLIYLRRNYEIIDDLGNEYHVLSNLFHKRDKSNSIDTRKEDEENLMDISDIDNGIMNIKKDIPNFDYDFTLSKIQDNNFLKNIFKNTQNNYIKIHIFRLLFDDQLNNISNVLRKYILESYHIENELICQLDPNEYDLVPNYIIEECTKYVEENVH
jgi:energy-coupling factor transporter ATP-binding protein EcfA2